jgi:hypothetical protein
MANNILPQMIKVTRNCGFTLQLHKIFEEKLSNEDIEILNRWLQIVNDETTIKVNNEKRFTKKF